MVLYKDPNGIVDIAINGSGHVTDVIFNPKKYGKHTADEMAAALTDALNGAQALVNNAAIWKSLKRQRHGHQCTLVQVNLQSS